MKRIIIVICVCLLSNCVVYWRQNHLSQLDTFPQKQLNAKINIVFDSFFEGNGINVSLDNIRIQQNAQLIQQFRASNLFADVGVSIKNPDYFITLLENSLHKHTNISGLFHEAYKNYHLF